LQLGKCHQRITPFVFNTYQLTETGEELLTVGHQILLPCMFSMQPPLTEMKNETKKENTGIKQQRKSKGTHLLPVLTKLLSSRDNWFIIDSSDDYYFPGKFSAPYPQRLGFAPDITTLPFYVKEDEHFLFNDIQIGKEKPRAPRKTKVNIEGKEEEMYYRIAPCGGVKHCPVEECSYTTSTREHRQCPQHSEFKLVAKNECAVEFVYVWPVDCEDKRRWISGIIRRGEMTSDNLHNHPLNQPTKVPSKVTHDIQHALELDQTLTTHEIMTGVLYIYFTSTAFLNR
jgi:hypothetical protein